MRTNANSNKLEIATDAQPQIKQTILRPLVPEKISDLLTSNGYAEESAQRMEAAARAIFNHQTLMPRGVALAVGARDAFGSYRVAQLAIYDGQEYVGAVALSENGGYVEGARPEASRALVENADASIPIATRFTLADGIYSAGLRNATPEAVIREAIQMLGAKTDLKALAPADQTVRLLYTRDFRDKAKAAGKVIYVGLTGSAGEADCYIFETASGAFRCFDPKAPANVPLPPTFSPNAPSNSFSNAPASLGDSGAVSINGILAPIRGAPVTSLYGMRFHPILHILRLHGGIDFGAPVGSRCEPAPTGRLRSRGRFTVLAIISGSSTGASKPRIRISRKFRPTSNQASRSSRARSSRFPATRGSRPDRICISNSTSTARRSIRCRISARRCKPRRQRADRAFRRRRAPRAFPRRRSIPARPERAPRT